jgi:DNA (cytosine-5)-methyltransferase 1
MQRPGEGVLRELALFAGAGGGILGGKLLGWRTVCAVELDPYCQRVLLARQRDGSLGRFPIWDDVRTFDGRPWRGRVDVVSGGFPCQDISSAGTRTGLSGERSGLWREFARILGEIRPAHVLVENSPHLRTRGLVTVLQDLAGLGFDARWGVLGAENIGAPHPRKRMWIVAHANDGRERNEPEHEQVACASSADRVLCTTAQPESERCRSRRARRLAASVEGQQQLSLHVADADSPSVWEQSGRIGGSDREGAAVARAPDWWPVDLIQGVDDGLANRMDRVAATGNGQVPGVAALAWRILI